MSTSVTVITPPAAEPVTVSEAKSHLRVDSTDDDTLIGVLITTAREWLESASGRCLITRTLEMTLDEWPAGDMIELIGAPAASVTSLTWTDRSGTVTTLSSSTDYLTAVTRAPGRVILRFGTCWPGTGQLKELEAIRLRYTAGYGAAGSAVPASLRQAILLLVGHWYANREATVITPGAGGMDIPLGVSALIAPYRVWGY